MTKGFDRTAYIEYAQTLQREEHFESLKLINKLKKHVRQQLLEADSEERDLLDARMSTLSSMRRIHQDMLLGMSYNVYADLLPA